VPTREAVAFARNANGFPTKIAKTIAAAVTTKILVVRIRDEIAALPQAFPIPGCSGSSVRSERKRGIRSFVAMGDASTLNAKSGIPGISFLLFLLAGTPAIEGLKKAGITDTS